MIGELRALLNDWDPIGVFQGGAEPEWPTDEYDCLHGLVLTSLRRGDSVEATAQLLDHEFKEHFGLPLEPDSCHSAADRLHDWYRGRGDDPGKAYT